MNRRTLGRGLSALLGSYENQEGQPMEEMPIDSGVPTTPMELPASAIDPNPFQPRQEFDPAELDGLAESIRVHGILQPIVVRQIGDRFQLVAGERRLRAAQHLGWVNVPARVIEISDQQTCELALVENLQRKDLNAIEKGRAFQRYLEQFQTTHEDLAKQLGIDRSTVTNLIRLLELPDAVQEMVMKGKISSGHARAILSIDDPIAQLTLANEVADKGMSVRQTEAMVREHRSGSPSATVAAPAPSTEVMPSEHAPPAPEVSFQPEPEQEPQKSNHIVSIENDLCQRLGTKVQIKAKGEKGEFILHFSSNDDFERILEQLRR